MPPDIQSRALQLLQSGFCTGTPYARTALGDPCAPTSKLAASWTIHGALLRAADDLELHHVLQAARLHVSYQLWSKYGLHLAWAELSGACTLDMALEVVKEPL